MSFEENMVPRTINEFIEMGWYTKIFNKVKKYHLRDLVNSPEDLTQQIICDLISSRYLERFDPSIRSFDVYIYVFVMNAIKKRAMRENSKNGVKITTAASLEYAMDDEEEFDPHVVYVESLNIKDQQSTGGYSSDFNMMLDSVREELKKFKASSSVELNGVTVFRDPLTLFNLMLDGFSIAEVADMWKTSKQFVYNCLRKIRSTAAMQELYTTSYLR